MKEGTMKEGTMIDSRSNARITGLLFMLGTVPMILAMVFFGRHLSAPDIVAAVAANRSSTLVFAVAIIVMGLSCAGIGISLYPVMKRHGPSLAPAVMGLRILEGGLQIVTSLGFFALVALSQELAKATVADAASLRILGSALRTANNFASTIAVPAFCSAALMYYAVFFRDRLVPRWLSLWGIVGILLLLFSTIAQMLGFLAFDSPVIWPVNMPILIQELVLAAWLMVKGYKE